MNSMIHEVNAAMATQPESSKSTNTLIGKDFKITLDELLKDLGTKNEISPLLGLLLALNPTLPLNDENTINVDNIAHQDNAPFMTEMTENNSIMQLLKSILPSNDMIIPLINIDSNEQNIESKSVYTNQPNGSISLPKTILTLLYNPSDSGEYVDISKSVSLKPDNIKTVLNNAAKVETSNTENDNQTQTATEGSNQKVLIGISKQGNKVIEDFKTVDMLKQASSEKHDLNIINASFNIPDVKVSDDKVSETVTVPSKVQIGDIIKQIAEGAKISVTDKSKGEAIINLKPPNLGKLLMEVMVDKNVVTAKITAQNSDVKNIIEANINQLKDSLSQQGMHVDSLMVSVGTGGFFDGRHQQGHERHQRYFFTDNDRSYEDYNFYSYVDKDHVDCIV